jgi:two-component sensor histidine kinase
MNLLKYFLILIVYSNYLPAITVDARTTKLDLLPYSKILINTNNTIEAQMLKDHTFIPVQKKVLGLGFVPHHAVWITFTLKNTTNTQLKKILEYAYPETESIHFYDGDRVVHDGMWHMKKDRESLNPNFEIVLTPNEERTFYLKVHAPITSLIIQLKLWNEKDFIVHDLNHRTYLFIFFSAIFILLIYNTLLLFFTQDKAYFYYIMYLSGVLLFESIYLGMAQLYFLSNMLSEFITKATFAYISTLVVPMILFAREFLNTHKFPKLDLFFKVYLWFIPLLIILSYDNFFFDQNIMAIYIPLGIALIYAGIYTYFHGQKQAKYYIIGWSFLIIALLLSILKSFGYFDVTQYFPYINETAFTLEALLFSIALAHRIKLLNEQKNVANRKLIELQKEKQSQLEKLVEEKTRDLQQSLQEKEVLYKELNHRVKNNLSVIISLISLQIYKTQLNETKDALHTTRNRIYSMAELYEMLNLHDNAISIDTEHYFQSIITNIENCFHKNVAVTYQIRYNLTSEKLIYVGLILNELVTNIFKYAFKESGEITISLFKKNNEITLIVEDNGIGFDSHKGHSLGLTIVKNLIETQLLGALQIDTKLHEGTKITITWSEKT